jgi:hypothetical protein
MRRLSKVAFLIEEFTTPSPAQQLLDRFLIGYPKDGAIHKPPCETVAAHLMLSLGESDFDRRSEDFGLVIAPDVERAVEGRMQS